jgi:hypothetical protein
MGVFSFRSVDHCAWALADKNNEISSTKCFMVYFL